MNKTKMTFLPALSLSLSVAACGGTSETPTTGSEPAPRIDQIDLNPTTLGEAKQSLEQIDAFEIANPNDARIVEVLDKLKAQLDVLNHLVARVSPRPGYAVSFYESEPGRISIAETGPINGERILQPEDFAPSSVTELYRRLASGAEPPQSLVDAEGRTAGARTVGVRADVPVTVDDGVVSSLDAQPGIDSEGIGRVRQAWGTGDASFWVNEICYTSANFFDCLPNWANGGFAQASAKTSFFDAANFDNNPTTTIGIQLKISGSVKFFTVLNRGESGRFNGWSDSFATCPPLIACGSFDYNRRTHRWDITSALNDSFHWTFAFKWTCGSVLSCDSWPPR
jgi:hypothetical protein